MSNKTRLQTNNTNLQALINKANSLPDAGSGGSGGSVETCTVTIMPCGGSTIYYVYNGQCISEATSGTIELTVTKNTILAINQGWSSMSVQSGSCEKLFYSMACAAYAIHGDCTLIGEDGPT